MKRKKTKHRAGPGRPKTTGPGHQLLLRIHDRQLALIDKHIAEQKKAMTRAEVLRQLVDEKFAGPSR